MKNITLLLTLLLTLLGLNFNSFTLAIDIKEIEEKEIERIKNDNSKNGVERQCLREKQNIKKQELLRCLNQELNNYNKETYDKENTFIFIEEYIIDSFQKEFNIVKEKEDVNKIENFISEILYNINITLDSLDTDILDDRNKNENKDLIVLLKKIKSYIILEYQKSVENL